jgi:multisubunit Na+/H+ antiporter MnhC subunit
MITELLLAQKKLFCFECARNEVSQTCDSYLLMLVTLVNFALIRVRLFLRRSYLCTYTCDTLPQALILLHSILVTLFLRRSHFCTHTSDTLPQALILLHSILVTLFLRRSHFCTHTSDTLPQALILMHSYL